MRKAIFLFASMTLVALFASGVALAYGGGNFNTVRCKGGECKGTSGWDRMIGTDRRDIEYAFKGIDDLYGRGGRDDLYGSGGEDYAAGGDGNDKLAGGDKADDLNGGNGSDFLNGGNHKDWLSGQAGDDELYGGPGEYEDVLMGESGDDRLNGGSGSDRYVFAWGWSNDTISDPDDAGGPSSASVEFSWGCYSTDAPVSDLSIDLNSGPGPEVSDDANGNNTVEWAEPGMVKTVIGGCGDDTITGDERPNILSGANGMDTVHGGGGNDLLYNGDEWSPDGNTLDGGEGDDRISGWGYITLRGGIGNDEMLANHAYGEDGLVTSVQGDAGNDTVKADDGQPDTIDCGDNNDTVFFDEGIDTVTNCETKNPR